MRCVASYHKAVFDRVETAGNKLLPIAARLVFAASLLVYFWTSAATKLGEGITGLFSPSVGAYAQIFPRQLEAASYDVSQLGMVHWAVVILGTWAEILLPLLITIGLLTRLAALGMIGFVVVQSLTDIFGHLGTDLKTLGAWFDRFPDGVILDQRLFWIFLLGLLVIKGAGPLSADGILQRRYRRKRQFQRP